jgi:hypothetical protein
MSRLTQIIDYLNREPKELNLDYIKSNYTHLTISDELKKIRKEKKLYKKN